MTPAETGSAAQASELTPPDTGAADPVRADLPVWPVSALFVGFPIWWLAGFVDIAWILAAAVMGLYLLARGGIRVPRGFGIWLLFLAWAAISVIMLQGGAMALVGFAYRYLLYASATVLAIYVYNARTTLTERYVAGCLTAWWAITVGGGYLGLLLPSVVIRTPMSYLLPDNLLANGLVNHMVVRRFAQYNADSFLQVAPRPSAPFLYTNNWGSVFSLLLPFVVIYMLHVRGTKRFWGLVALLMASTVPALLTLNRGMFLGIGVALLYAVVRLALMGRFKAIAALAGLALVGVVAFQALPIEQRLNDRLSSNADATSNDTRASLYLQALDLVPQSPFFGYGAPQTGAVAGAAPVGTQGQIWLLLVSHGPIAAAAYVGWFLFAFVRSRRRRDPMGIACQTVLVVGTVEVFYYGMVPNGLPIMMIAAALALRGPDRPSTAAVSPARPAVEAGPRAGRG